MLHVAIVPSRHPAARIVSIDATAALGVAGVHHVLTGAELAAAVDPMLNGLDTPRVRRYSLAVGQTRYAGEWVAAVAADTRAIAEDAAELVAVEYEPLRHVIDVEQALDPASAQVHPEHGSNVLLDKTFVWGEVEKHFAESPRQLSFRVTWGRSATVPIETFGVLASWDPWNEMLDVWASIQMPKYSEQIARALRLPANAVRVHYDVDVGGSYGVKRGIKHTVLVAYLARRLGRPVRLIEDRLDNMRSGDQHGPDRIFDVSVAFDDAGIIRSMKMRALDNVGAYAGRAPFQLGKPIGAIVGPYRIESVQYRALSVMTNKAAQEAVRGFGQSPTNYAIETAIDKVAAGDRHRPARGAAAQFHPQGGIPLLDPERHALRQRRLSYGGRQGAGACRLAGAGARARPSARIRIARRHRDRRMPGAERRQLVVRAAAQSEEHHHDLDGFLPHRGRRARAHHGDDPHDVVRPGTRDAGCHRRGRSAGDRPGPHPRGAAGFAREPAEQFAGRQPHGGDARRRGISRGAEAQKQAHGDRGASARGGAGCARLCGRGDHREDERHAPRMDRPRHHRAPQHPPDGRRASSPGSRSPM
jgi:hypothetical protein